MKYHLLAIEGCSQKLLSFKTKKKRTEYINNFIKKYGSMDDKGDNWIEMIFNEKVKYSAPDIKEGVK